MWRLLEYNFTYDDQQSSGKVYNLERKACNSTNFSMKGKKLTLNYLQQKIDFSMVFIEIRIFFASSRLSRKIQYLGKRERKNIFLAGLRFPSRKEALVRTEVESRSRSSISWTSGKLFFELCKSWYRNESFGTERSQLSYYPIV